MSEQNPYEAPNAELDQTSRDGTVLASRGIRLGAAVIDGVISLLVTVPLMMVTGYWERAMSGTQGLGETIILSLLGFGIFLLIHGYFLATSGQTVGKKMLGTQIVSVEDGSLLPLPRLIGLRYLPLAVVANLPFVGGVATIINVLFIFREDRRCVHDLIAGTHVVELRK